jgi:1,4-alpha-glucan branching enzyme
MGPRLRVAYTFCDGYERVACGIWKQHGKTAGPESENPFGGGRWLKQIKPSGGSSMKKSAGGKDKFTHFELEAEPGRRVFVAGSFNGWDPAANPMMDNPDSGHYKAAIRLPPGRHEYKFVVDGEWRVDPKCPARVSTGSGMENSVLVV